MTDFMLYFAENKNYAELDSYFRMKIDHLWKRDGKLSC